MTKNKPETQNSTPGQLASKEQAFNFQLELLKFELEIIDKTISRFDEHIRSTRNWALVSWSASIGFCLSDVDLRQYVIITTIIPFLFWLIDARWTKLLRAFIFRQDRITEFLNDDTKFSNSFSQKKIIGLRIYDPRGKSYKRTPAYKEKVNLQRALFRYGEVSVFYIGVIITSLVLGVYILLNGA